MPFSDVPSSVTENFNPIFSRIVSSISRKAIGARCTVSAECVTAAALMKNILSMGSSATL